MESKYPEQRLEINPKMPQQQVDNISISQEKISNSIPNHHQMGTNVDYPKVQFPFHLQENIHSYDPANTSYPYSGYSPGFVNMGTIPAQPFPSYYYVPIPYYPTNTFPISPDYPPYMDMKNMKPSMFNLPNISNMHRYEAPSFHNESGIKYHSTASKKLNLTALDTRSEGNQLQLPSPASIDSLPPTVGQLILQSQQEDTEKKSSGYDSPNKNEASKSEQHIIDPFEVVQQEMDITSLLVLPQTIAAKELGIPTSTLSKRWREATKNRKWPFRTVAKIDKKIYAILQNAPNNNSDNLDEKSKDLLASLFKKRQEELKNVNIRM